MHLLEIDVCRAAYMRAAYTDPITVAIEKEYGAVS